MFGRPQGKTQAPSTIYESKMPPRKWHNSSQSLGTLAASVVKTGPAGAFALTSQEKFDKARSHIKEMKEMLEKYPTIMNPKQLEQI
jgi:hypothetical protein